jgi:two-component system, chemotaxis family, protein-glutamate methylesterase/glutaminase
VSRSRVLVVDDAVVFRRLLTETISADADLEVVESAANGRIALQKLATSPVDAVVLDVEMPDLDGIATLKELRKLYPRLPVLMFSSLTERGAEATLDALLLGANDYFTKPTTSSMEASIAVVKDQLIPKLKAVIAQEAERSARNQAVSISIPSASAASIGMVKTSVELLVVAASTGGPNALLEFIRGLPADLPVPIAAVQHMPPIFTKYLADRLAANSSLNVTEARDGESLEKGKVLLAPGDFHLEIERAASGVLRTKLHRNPLENSVRPAADVLFRSAAHACGPGVLAVVLTGMGMDGKAGAEKIVSAGGRVVVQDLETSVVWGMPGAVARAGLADGVYPLKEIAGAVLRRMQSRRVGGTRP